MRLPTPLRYCTYYTKDRQESESQLSADYEKEINPIYYPDFSSVAQGFSAMEDSESEVDVDASEERLRAVASVWESTIAPETSQRHGDFSLLSPLINLAEDKAEDVMRKSQDYAACLHRESRATTNGPVTSHNATMRAFSSIVGMQGTGFHTRSFCTTIPRRAVSATPYQLLGVSPSASAAEIKSQFYAIAKKLHPDKLDPNLTKKEQDERLEQFRLVVKAYELLKDQRQRDMYDRYRVGWESTTDVPPRAHWSSPGQYRPRTQQEWEQWNLWSEMLRRQAHNDHSHAWQRMARDHATSHHFYGYTRVTPEDAKRQQESAPINHRIFFLLFFLGSVIATIQIDGAKKFSARDSGAAAQHTSMVARNLEQARMHARSEEGLLRQRLMLERARENRKAKEQAELPLLSS